VRVDGGVNEKALRRVLSAVRGWDDRPAGGTKVSSPAGRSICAPGDPAGKAGTAITIVSVQKQVIAAHARDQKLQPQ
jgi:hypothetical protein